MRTRNHCKLNWWRLAEDAAREDRAGLGLRPNAFERESKPALRKAPARDARTFRPRAAYYLALLTMSCTVLTPSGVSANPASQQTSAESSATSANNPQGVAVRAVPVDKPRPPAAEKPSVGEPGHARSPLVPRPPNHRSVSKPSHPELPANHRLQSMMGKGVNVHSVRSDKIGLAGKTRLSSNPSAHSAEPIRLSSTARPAAPPVSSVRHRGPNPAVIAGSVNPGRTSNGAIDGTRMHRKP
jgi:hypothetical protein